MFIATYEHRHGKDVEVFATQAEANGWRTEIALRDYEAEIGDIPAGLTDKQIADKYFEAMSDRGDRGEWFSIYEKPARRTRAGNGRERVSL